MAKLDLTGKVLELHRVFILVVIVEVILRVASFMSDFGMIFEGQLMNCIPWSDCEKPLLLLSKLVDYFSLLVGVL